MLLLLALLACDGDPDACAPVADREDCATPEDDDCSGTDNDVDAAGCTLFYLDDDEDGFGGVGNTGRCTCEAEREWTAPSADDCEDADATVNPGADEVCDGVDNDCSGGVDDDPIDLHTWYADADGDGFGIDGDTQDGCGKPTGYAFQGGDCDDALAGVNPGTAERCSALDDDCDPSTGEAGKVSAWKSNGSFDRNYADFASAFTGAEEGGTVTVCAGTHAGGVTRSTGLTLRGIGGTDAVILEGDGVDPVLELTGGDHVVEGLTVTGGGNEYFGGGIDAHLTFGGSVEIRDVVARGNTSKYGGGIGIAADGGATLERVVARDNVVEDGGGGIHVFETEISLVDVTCADNVAGHGGGLAITNDSVAIAEGLVLSGNSAEDYGGGLAMLESDVTLGGGAITGNAVTGGLGDSGGGIYIASKPKLVVAGTDFADNTPDDVGNIVDTWDFGADASFTCSETAFVVTCE